ncbi:MAG TPA: cyclic nucleotide-binding domain-containing protein [Thermoanaerobaculia bacterium]|jgi:CRP-like cAMP-binding protein|nr:cyclic nucleotide-binding domain-containing protein [Thermoanaerobaculia bacterium]
MAASFLRQVAIFEGIDERRLAELEAGGEERSLDAHQVVFQRDDLCDGLYLVKTGGVVIRNQVVGQPIERVRDIGPGDLFGEVEVLDGSRRQFQARTLGSTTLLRLPRDSFLTFLSRHPLVETRLRTLSIYRRTERLHSLLAPSTRRDPRIRLDREVELQPAGGRPVTARIEDLSHGGACLSAVPESWRPGDTVSFALAVPGHPDLLQLEAKVRWRMSGVVGLVFEPPSSPRKHARQIERALRVLLAAG